MKKKFQILVATFALCSASAIASDVLPADTNGDGSVTKEDAALIYSYILGTAPEDTDLAAVDVNRDGKANTADVVAVYRSMYLIIDGTASNSDDSEFSSYGFN